MTLEGARYRFEMGRVIGEGSFGVVYRARMHLLGGISKPVAIKVLHENLDAGTRARERLLSEARILGRMSDPGIVAVNELTQLAGRQALVMEYVPGRDLRDCFVTDPPISARATLEVVAKVASTLHNAWTKPGDDGQPLHLVHRDIKPENIRVTEAGDVKLLDFGIAKPASARTWSSEQEALGTLLYMAPELFRGGEGTKQQLPARDVFGLGCILYEAVAGHALFEGKEVADVMRLGMDRAAFDAHLDAKLAEAHGISGDLAALLRVMLAWDPKLRPDPIRVADVAYTLLDTTPGPRLFPWCRSLEWVEPVGTEGDLTGRTLEPEDSAPTVRASSAFASMSEAPAPPAPAAPPMAPEVPDDAPPPPPPPPPAPRVAPARRGPEPALLAGAGVVVLGLAALLVVLALGERGAPEAAPVVPPIAGPAPALAEVPAALPWTGWVVGDCGLDEAYAAWEPAVGGWRSAPAEALACPSSAEGVAPGVRLVGGAPDALDALVALAWTSTCPGDAACPTSPVAALPAVPAAPARTGAGSGSARLTAAKGCVAVEVRAGGRRTPLRATAVAVPAGPIEIHARFEGRSWEKQVETRLRAGGQLVVECSCVSQLCSVR